MDLYIAADRFGITKLKNHLLPYFRDTMTFKNIINRTRSTLKTTLKELADKCSTYVKQLPNSAIKYKIIGEIFDYDVEDIIFISNLLVGAKDEYSINY